MKRCLTFCLAMLTLLLTFGACASFPTEKPSSDLPSGNKKDNGNTEKNEPAKPLSDKLPEAIVSEVCPSAVFRNSGTSCREAILTLKNKEELTAALTAEDFTPYAFDGIAGAKFETLIYTRGDHVVTLYWQEEESGSGEMRVLMERSYHNDLEVTKPNAQTGKGSVTVVQVGTERVDEKDNPLVGMCYIVKLSDGRALLIDGGFPNDACTENLWKTLNKMEIAADENGKLQIAAWIFTHGHGDHIGTFRTFSAKYAARVAVEHFVYNLPGDNEVAPEECDEQSFERLIYSLYPGAKRVTPHAGVQYYFGNATVSMLYTPELYYNSDQPISYFNDAGLVFQVTAGGASALFLGDAGEAPARIMTERYERTAFRSDILQILHHGLYTSSYTTDERKEAERHTWTYLRMLYEATGAEFAFLPMQSKYGTGNDRNGRYTVMIQWCNAGYQISYVMNENDNHGDAKITQADYNQFVDDVAAGTASYDTLYGYDGVNKVVNEQGMVTYLGGNELAPMLTAFSLADGKATLLYNLPLADYLT